MLRRRKVTKAAPANATKVRLDGSRLSPLSIRLRGGQKERGRTEGGDRGIAGDPPTGGRAVLHPGGDGFALFVTAGVAGVADDGEEAAGFEHGGGGIEAAQGLHRAGGDFVRVAGEVTKVEHDNGGGVRRGVVGQGGVRGENELHTVVEAGGLEAGRRRVERGGLDVERKHATAGPDQLRK